jgi:signal transduction histidine kinase
LERTLALSSANELLRALSARIDNAKEEEAARIARDIHDQLGSSLASLRWRLETIEEHLKSASAPVEPAYLLARIEKARADADQLVATVHRMALQLRPPGISDLSLMDAIEALAKEFEERTGIKTEFEKSPVMPRLSEGESTALFRILQQCLTNVQQHSQATQVQIRFQIDANEVTMSVVDNGRGITEAERTSRKSLGLWSMRERAQLMGADLEIRGADAGTTVTVRLPRQSG